MCVMYVIVGNKITSSSLDSFLKSLEMQSEGGLMRLCLEVCCVYLFIILNHSKQTICNLNPFNSLIYNAYTSFKYWLDFKIRMIIWLFLICLSEKPLHPRLWYSHADKGAAGTQRSTFIRWKLKKKKTKGVREHFGCHLPFNSHFILYKQIKVLGFFHLWWSGKSFKEYFKNINYFEVNFTVYIVS